MTHTEHSVAFSVCRVAQYWRPSTAKKITRPCDTCGVLLSMPGHHEDIELFRRIATEAKMTFN